jgi:uncharacterized protein YndB with AHSA1/START domain
MKTTDKPIIVEQVYTADAKTLWKAITDPEEMKKWYFDNIPDFKAEVGFETQFPVQSENRMFTHQWKITEVIPLKKIIYNWKYSEYPGEADTIFELVEEEKKGTRLKLTMIVNQDFPGGIPEFTRESCIGGWNYFLGENLSNYLNNK